MTDVTPGVAARSPGSGRRFKIALGLFSLIVFLVAGEASIRLYLAMRGWTSNVYAAHLLLFVPDPQLGERLRANFYLKSGVYEITINDRGFRGPPISAGPSDRVRVVTLGGSSVFGYFVSDGEEWPRVVERRLRERGLDVEVINAGVPGYSLYQSNPLFERDLLPLQPDLLVLYAGWNDLAYATSETPDAERFRKRPISPKWERLLGHSALYGVVRYRLLGTFLQAIRISTRDTIAGSTPFERTEVTREGAERFRRHLRDLHRLCSRDDVQLVVCLPAMAKHGERKGALPGRAPSGMASLEQWLRNELVDFAREAGALLVDVDGTIAGDSSLLADYIHLTLDGESRAAEVIEKAIAEPIEKVHSASRRGTRKPGRQGSD